jgi:hypothetical protein
MARRAATATPPKAEEPPVSTPAVDELDEENIRYVDAVPGASTADDEAPSEGVAESDVQEPAPAEQELEAVGIAPVAEDEDPRVTAARAAQGAADARANELERLLTEQQAQRIIENREANRQRKRLLAERDPQTFIDETLREDEREVEAERSFNQYEGTVLDWTKRSASVLYPELTPEALYQAESEMHQLAARQGRRATAAEVLAMYGEYRVRLSRTDVESKDTRIKELEEKVAALQNGETGDLLEGDEGPESPAAPGVRRALSAKAVQEMDDEEYEARREDIMNWQARHFKGG